MEKWQKLSFSYHQIPSLSVLLLLASSLASFTACRYLSNVLFAYSVGAGTAHGFGLIDYVQKIEVTNRCTLNPQGTYDMIENKYAYDFSG